MGRAFVLLSLIGAGIIVLLTILAIMTIFDFGSFKPYFPASPV